MLEQGLLVYRWVLVGLSIMGKISQASPPGYGYLSGVEVGVTKSGICQAGQSRSGTIKKCLKSVSIHLQWTRTSGFLNRAFG